MGTETFPKTDHLLYELGSNNFQRERTRFRPTIYPIHEKIGRERGWIREEEEWDWEEENIDIFESFYIVNNVM